MGAWRGQDLAVGLEADLAVEFLKFENMAILDRAALKTLIESRIADNATGQTNEDDLREVMNAMVDSGINAIDDVGSAIGVVQDITVTIPSASVLTANGSPVEVIPAPGAGKIIKLISGVKKVDYGTTPYATNTNWRLQYEGAASGINTVQTIDQNATKYDILGFAALSNYAAVDIENKAVEFFVQTGNPTAGDSDLVFNLQYVIIEL